MKNSYDVFETRYPQLAFLTSLDQERYSIKTSPFLNAYHKETSEAVYEEKSLQDELKTFKQLLKTTETTECIVCFGLGLGHFFLEAKKWLQENPKRDLIFIEVSLWKIKAFLETEYALEFFSHPQVHLRFIMDDDNFLTAFDEITHDFPVELVTVTALSVFKSCYDFCKLKELYLRRAIISSSLYKEEFFSDRLFENFFPNYLKLVESRNLEGLKGSFEGIPAVICGAGPSLNQAIQPLKELNNKALVFAGGSTITALSRKGVDVSLSFAVDPNEEEYERLKQSQDFQSPLFYATRVHPKIFRFFNGELGYFRTCTGGAFEKALEDILDITQEPFHKGMKDEGLSVTVLCLAAAIAMGCYPIFLVGIDLAYTENKCYADDVVLDNDFNPEDRLGRDLKLIEKNTQNELVTTNLKWIMESEVISHFAKLHDHIEFYDCVTSGLGFKGIEKCSLENMLRKCQDSYDLKGLVHQKLVQLPHLSKYKEQLFSYLKELKNSFKTCLALSDQIIDRAHCISGEEYEEDPLISLYIIEFEEELADQYFLKFSREKIDLFFFERYLKKSPKERFFIKKWEHVRFCINSYLLTMSFSF